VTDEQDRPPELSEIFARISEAWRAQMEQVTTAGRLWSDSVMPFLTARAAESSLFAAAQGGEVSEAIKRMVEGPRLADVWGLDRQIYTFLTAWMDIRQRMATYYAVVSVPWNRAFDRYNALLKESKSEDWHEADWRKQFGTWSSIANEELIKNQRSEEFLTAQRELLRSALELRSQQQGIADSMAKLFGLPTQQDFDELTRQLTEVRRELRTHLRTARRAGGTESPSGEDEKIPPDTAERCDRRTA
jgi:hypothetical protein